MMAVREPLPKIRPPSRSVHRRNQGESDADRDASGLPCPITGWVESRQGSGTDSSAIRDPGDRPLQFRRPKPFGGGELIHYTSAWIEDIEIDVKVGRTISEAALRHSGWEILTERRDAYSPNRGRA